MMGTTEIEIPICPVCDKEGDHICVDGLRYLPHPDGDTWGVHIDHYNAVLSQNEARQNPATQVPRKLFDTFETPTKHHTSMLRFCRRWVDQYEPHTRGALMLGPSGSGKSHLLYAMLGEVKQRYGARVELHVVPNLVNDWKRAIDDPETSPQLIVQRLQGVQILALDDLAAERQSEFALENLYTIIDYRVLHSLTTLITTNVPKEDWSEAFGRRLESRLHELCVIYGPTPNTDYRRRLAGLE